MSVSALTSGVAYTLVHKAARCHVRRLQAHPGPDERSRSQDQSALRRQRSARCCCIHGNPLTHVHWHLVAPRLAKDFTVVVDRSARLRRQRQAARARGPQQLFVPPHGAGPGRGDGAPRLRAILRRGPRSRRARRLPHGARPSGQGARSSRASTSCRRTTSSRTRTGSGRSTPITGSSWRSRTTSRRS